MLVKDQPVGKGTGVFQGETVFQTAENRAGFVVLSTLEILPRPSEMNGDKHQLNVLKHKQVLSFENCGKVFSGLSGVSL